MEKKALTPAHTSEFESNKAWREWDCPKPNSFSSLPPRLACRSLSSQPQLFTSHRWSFVCPAHPLSPVYLNRIDYHAVWLNSAAVRLADDRGLIPDEDPQGGAILRDPDGRPTGVFIDTAVVGSSCAHMCVRGWWFYACVVVWWCGCLNKSLGLEFGPASQFLAYAHIHASCVISTFFRATLRTANGSLCPNCFASRQVLHISWLSHLECEPNKLFLVELRFGFSPHSPH